MAQTPTQYQVAEDVLPSCRRALIICAGLSGLLDLKPIRVLPLAEFPAAMDAAANGNKP
jgi:hypothetical protein